MLRVVPTAGRAGAGPPPLSHLTGTTRAGSPPPGGAPGQNPHPRRKRIRIDHAAYAEPTAICAVTIATRDRQPVFAESEFTAACATLLVERAALRGVIIYAYCFMPDHLHVLLSPSQRASIIDFIREFKSLSTRLAWQRGRVGKVWQGAFYDHFLRQDEDLRRHVEYLLNNPVRRGIVADWRQYPFSGAPVCEAAGDEANGGGQAPARPPVAEVEDDGGTYHARWGGDQTAGDKPPPYRVVRDGRSRRHHGETNGGGRAPAVSLRRRAGAPPPTPLAVGVADDGTYCDE